jgi:hypothetical protein
MYVACRDAKRSVESGFEIGLARLAPSVLGAVNDHPAAFEGTCDLAGDVQRVACAYGV